jgi:DNA-binding SARP family transcriptional activator
VRLGILGPLLVADDTGREMPVPAARQRVLLAALLVRANRVVPAEDLAEIVWDGAPSGGALGTLRSYAMRLRHAVGPVVAARIETRAPGYLCLVAEDELDLLRFEAQCEHASAARRSGTWTEVADAATRALNVWRGSPLLDVPSQALSDSVVPRLQQLRLQALEDYAEAGLHLGQHDSLVPRLRDLTAQYPLRERFHAQLMQALAMSGRQAEALEAYQGARRALVGELGIEPGPELRRLHRRVLAGDAEVPARVMIGRASPPVSAPVPRQLPAVARFFTGRQAELDLLTRLLDESGRDTTAGDTVVISAMDGMAGIGKTALAVHAAHRLAVKFPDGQLFIDLHGYTRGHRPRTAGDALDWLLRALRVAPQRIPQDLEERAALYRECLAGTRTLIVLDNACDEAQVRPLLPGSGGCRVLITSRRRLKGLDDAQILSLDVLPPADAIALLRMVAGPGRVPPGGPALAEIAGLCGRLPLALRIAAALLRHRSAWTPEHLAGLLRDQQQRITALSDGDRDLGAIFDLSYHALTGTRRRLFRQLGLVPGPDTDACAASALAGVGRAAATRLLEDLVDHNLLIEHQPGRYRLHDLIRVHARTLAGHDPADDRTAALDRLLDYYQHAAARADALIARHPRPAPAGPAPAPALPDAGAAWAWLRAERPNLVAVFEHTVARGYRERTVALAAGLATLLHVDGPWALALTVHVTASAAAGSLGDQRGRADALTWLGYMRALTGDFPGGARDMEQALQLGQDMGDRSGQAGALTRLGEMRRTTGDVPGAARDLAEALRLYQDLGHRPGQADVLVQLGDMRRTTGDIARAARDLERALQLYRDLDHPVGQGDVLTRLADMRRATGDLPGAARDLQEALLLYRGLGRRLGQANVLARLGDIWKLTGDLPRADRDLREALDLYQDLGHQFGQANALTFLGQVRLAAGDYPGAAHHLEAAVAEFRRMGTRGNQAWALNHYAAVITANGDHAHAMTLYQDALRLAREAHHPDDEALALEGLGNCLLRTADPEAGTADLRQALEIFRRLAMEPDADRVRARLTQVS